MGNGNYQDTEMLKISVLSFVRFGTGLQPAWMLTFGSPASVP